MPEKVASEKDKLTIKQQEYIIALISHSSLADAAKAIGIDEKTGKRWRNQPGFQKALHSAQDVKFSGALQVLRAGVSTAIKTLLKNMTSEDVPPSVQVRAAQIWLDHALATYEQDTLETKHAEIMARLQALGVKP